MTTRVELPTELNNNTILTETKVRPPKIMVVCMWLNPSVKMRWCIWLRSALKGESPFKIRKVNTRKVSNIGPISKAKASAGAQ